jgi:hypothetical protein
LPLVTGGKPGQVYIPSECSRQGFPLTAQEGFSTRADEPDSHQLRFAVRRESCLLVSITAMVENASTP